MDKLQSLKIKKLLKELDFNISMYDIVNETIREADSHFMEDVNNYASDHPSLNEKLQTKIDNIDNDLIIETNENNNEESFNQITENEEASIEEKTDKLKKIFREIVKRTHPDKIKDNTLNDLYKKTVTLYEDNDLIGLYNICDTLNIDYNIDENDIILITDKITTIKKRTDFLKNTFTWKWFNTNTKQDREEIIKLYINNL